MEFPNLINWMAPFRMYRLLGTKFQFHSNFESTFSEQTVKKLIRRRSLVWFCTDCRRLIKRAIGLNGLSDHKSNFLLVYINDTYACLHLGRQCMP